MVMPVSEVYLYTSYYVAQKQAIVDLALARFLLPCVKHH